MQRNRILVTALVGGLSIGAASTGFVVAQLVSYSRPGYAGQYQPAASTSRTAAAAAPAAPAAPAPAPATPDPGRAFSDPSLADFIAQKTGTGLAGRAPQNVPVSQVGALSDQAPAGASVDPWSSAISFRTDAVSFTVVAIAPGRPDMTFTVAGLSDPAISVPKGARVTVRFINNDTDEAHGWLVTDSQPPFEFGQPAVPAIPGASAGVIGDPTTAGDGATTFAFTASEAGSYQYICPMPGHAQMGMHGSFTVRPGGA